jgi:hypothetical protein
MLTDVSTMDHTGTSQPAREFDANGLSGMVGLRWMPMSSHEALAGMKVVAPTLL